MARKCSPSIAIANEPDFSNSIFVEDNLDPNTIVFDDMDLGCTTPRALADPTPSLEGYWDRDSDAGVLYPKVLADMVMVGKTAPSYDETFGVVGKIYSTAGYMMGPGTQLISAYDSTTMGIYVTDRNSLLIRRGHLRGTQGNAPMINTLDSTASASTPPYTFYTDQDTGMYRHEANGLAFTGGGVNKMVLNADGTIQLVSTPATAADAAVPVLARNASTGLIEQRVLSELHTHANSAVLDLLTAPAGSLWYNGALVFDASQYYTQTVIDAAHVVLQTDIDTRSLNTHNHALAGLTEQSYNSLSDTPDLSDLHAHSNKTTLDRIPNYVGAGVEEGDVMERRGAGISWVDVYNPNAIQLRAGYTPATEPAGLMWWNDNELALNIATGIGPVLQTGQEMYILIYNDSGSQFDNGIVLRPKAATLHGGQIVPTVEPALADVFSTIEGTLMMATMDIPNGAVGLCTIFGRVRGMNTAGLTPGATAYVSPTVPGGLTNTRPSFPNYEISMGAALSSASDGEFIVSITRDYKDTFQNFWNGAFRESFSFTVSSAGGVVTGSLVPTNGNVDMTMIFSDGFDILDTNPAATIVLTAGTDDVPQMNYVYVLRSTKALTVSTSDWPVTEHIRVATIYLRSAATTLTEDALKNHNWNDHLQGVDGQGHLSHLGQKLRKFEAQWESGCELSAVVRTVPSPDELYVTVTGGSVFQLHPQAVDPFDTEAADNIHVWNNFTNPFLTIKDLATQTADSTGTTLSNKHYSVVIWGSASSAGEPAHLFMNLPSGSYNSAVQALSDPNNYASYIIPLEFSGTGYLLARLVLQFSGGTANMTVTATEDLRGKIPNTSAGGGSIGGAGATTHLALTDTPATFVGAGLMAVRVAAGETTLEYSSTLNLDTIDEWATDAGVTIDGITLKDYVISVPDGSSSDGTSITIQAGDPDGAGNDGGSVILKAGDGTEGISSGFGGVYLMPGSPENTSVTAQVFLGDATYNADVIGIQTIGSQTDVDMALSTKGAGKISLLSANIDLWNLSVYDQTSTMHITAASTYTMDIHAAAGLTDADGKNITVRAGDGNGTGDGGDLFIHPGAAGATGTIGNVYFGTGAAGYLAAKGAETNVVYYETTTGKLTYGAAGASAPIDNILDWNGTAYAPYSARAAGVLYSGTTIPTSSTRLNYDGEFYAFNLYAAAGSDKITITGGGQMIFYTGGANQTILQPYVGDGAGAFAYFFDTENSLTTEGSVIATFKSNGTSRFVIHGQGELQVSARSTTGLPTPAANYGLLYQDSADDKLYFKTSATTYDLTGAGGTSISFGDTGQIPYMNTGTPGDDFLYSANFTYATNAFTFQGSSVGDVLAVVKNTHTTGTASRSLMSVSCTNGGGVILYGYGNNHSGSLWGETMIDGAAVYGTTGTTKLLIGCATAGSPVIIHDGNGVEVFRTMTTGVHVTGTLKTTGGNPVLYNSSDVSQRLTIVLSTADMVSIYNYDETGPDYHNIKLGNLTSAKALEVDGDTGNVGINAVPSGTYDLYIGGSVYATGDIIGNSDIRYKDVLGEVPFAWEDFMGITPIRYRSLLNEGAKPTFGFSSQEMMKYWKEPVTYDTETERYGMKYNAIIPINTKAIQKVKTEVDELRERVAELEDEVVLLKRAS